LRQLVLNPALKAVALEHIAQASFGKLPEPQRFDALHDYLKRYSSKSKAKVSAASARKWLSPDQSVAFAMSRNPKKVSIELSRENAAPFGDWLTGRLDVLFNEFRQSRENENGD
jgi:ParB family chromosome partitioning protein